MVPSRREWRRNLRCECRAQDSSGCRPGYCGPDVSAAPDAARTVSRSQLRLGGNVRVVEAAGGIHRQSSSTQLGAVPPRLALLLLVVAADPRRRQPGDRRVRAERVHQRCIDVPGGQAAHEPSDDQASCALVLAPAERRLGRP